MEDLFNSVYSTHRGLSISTIILFGSFIFLLLQTHLGYNGRITEVLKKTAFFSMILLYIQGVLGLFMGVYSPELSKVSGFGAVLKHFEYAICILISAGMMTYVQLFMKKNQVLTLKIVVIALVSALVFEYAYPWAELLGFN